MRPNKAYADFSRRVARLLREERLRQGLSKYAVEQRCGLSQQMIGYIERGLRKPSLEIAFRLADGLGLSLADVIARAERAAESGSETMPTRSKPQK
ncbi:MAG TPA: helix-turn-helix transcriptional regulator [Methylomirabilota bacterium]|nr:helix-turn-helix transcriptional regulator [Methylomirabilota bacterium]